MENYERVNDNVLEKLYLSPETDHKLRVLKSARRLIKTDPLNLNTR